MIFYEVQAHSNFSSLGFLADLLSAEGNILNFSLDAEGERVEECEEFLQRSSSGLCKISVGRTPELSWGGFSIVQRMIDSLIDALKVPGWEYYANLSANCIPLKSQNHIFERLRFEKLENGKTNFCYSFEPRRPRSWIFGGEHSYAESYQYARVRLQTSQLFKNALEKGSFAPTNDVMQRVSAKFSEIGKNEYSLEALTVDDILRREAFLNAHGLNIGRQWVILHRDTIESVINSGKISEVVGFLKDCFIPDEMFFQMLLLGRRSIWRDSVSTDNLRYKGGAPARISNSTLTEALGSPALFGRKVEGSHYGEIAREVSASFGR